MRPIHCRPGTAEPCMSKRVIRNTQYAIRNPPHGRVRNTQYAIRNTQSTSRLGA